MGSGALIYVPSFIKMGSGVQISMGGGYTDASGQQRDLFKPTLFFQNKESGLKKKRNWRFYRTTSRKRTVLTAQALVEFCDFCWPFHKGGNLSYTPVNTVTFHT
jgi:hypothetical protein